MSWLVSPHPSEMDKLFWQGGLVEIPKSSKGETCEVRWSLCCLLGHFQEAGALQVEHGTKQQKETCDVQGSNQSNGYTESQINQSQGLFRFFLELHNEVP